jgi:hypothetical protein
MSHSFPNSRGSSICLCYAAGRKMSDVILDQQINIRFCMKSCKSANEMLILLTLSNDEYAMNESSIF